MIKFCSLFSGSSGNALFIGTERTKLLIDAGLSGKRILEALCSIGENPAELSAILISHEHVDHVRGAGILSRKQDIPIYANESTWEAMETGLGPVKLENRKCFTTGDCFEIGDICVRPFSIPHDAAEPVGYNFMAEGKKITTATDIGHATNELIDNISESDLLLLESNHDIEMLKVGPYPWPLKKRILGDHGHLSNEIAAKIIAYMAEKGGKRFILGHLSHENNFPELAYQTSYNALTEKKIAVGSDVMLEVARRDRAGSINIL